MKLRPLLLLALLGLSASADTIRMRDGTEYTGIILSEDDEAYTAAIQVTPRIRDERRLLKSDVLEIVQVKKDEVAFEALKKLVPTPDLLTANDYRERINALEAFTSEFSDSKHLPAVEEILKELDKEREVIAGGGCKFEGKLISGSDRASRAYLLDSRIAAAKIPALGDAGDYVGALRAWSDLERDYLGSGAYRDTLPYVLKVMRTQLQLVNRQIDSYDQRVQERNANLDAMSAGDRSRSKLAIAEEEKAYLDKVEAEKKANTRWLSTSPWNKEVLQSTKSQLEQEIRRLESQNPEQLPDPDTAWTEAWNTLSGNPAATDATAAVSAARSARLPKAYLDILEAKVPKK